MRNGTSREKERKSCCFYIANLVEVRTHNFINNKDTVLIKLLVQIKTMTKAFNRTLIPTFTIFIGTDTGSVTDSGQDYRHVQKADILSNVHILLLS